MKEIVATIRPKPKLIIPNEQNLQSIWDTAKKDLEEKPSLLIKFLTCFTFRKELVHPKDHRIFCHKTFWGKTIFIGRVSYDNFHTVDSFEELTKLDASRYIT